MHKIKNHIAKNFKTYFRFVFLLQWLTMCGFIGFGVFGMWFFSLICIICSFLFYVLRIVVKHHTVQSFIHSIKNLDPFKMLDHLPIGGRKKRNIKRKIKQKHSKF